MQLIALKAAADAEIATVLSDDDPTTLEVQDSPATGVASFVVLISDKPQYAEEVAHVVS